MRNYFSYFIIAFGLLILSSCSFIKDQILYQDVDASGWDSSLEFLYENKDTISQRSVTLFMRYDKAMNYNSADFSLNITSPLGYLFSDTINIEFPKVDPQRVTLINFEEEIIKNALFDKEGVYSFELKPLEEKPLKGVYNVGFGL